MRRSVRAAEILTHVIEACQTGTAKYASSTAYDAEDNVTLRGVTYISVMRRAQSAMANAWSFQKDFVRSYISTFSCSWMEFPGNVLCRDT
jgi:hypothetical protein